MEIFVAIAIGAALGIVISVLGRAGVSIWPPCIHRFETIRTLGWSCEKIRCVRCRRLYVWSKDSGCRFGWDRDWELIELTLDDITADLESKGFKDIERRIPRHVREAEEIIEKGGL